MLHTSPMKIKISVGVHAYTARIWIWTAILTPVAILIKIELMKIRLKCQTLNGIDNY